MTCSKTGFHKDETGVVVYDVRALSSTRKGAVSGRSEKGKDEGARLSVDGGSASGLEQTIALGKIYLLVFLFLICAWKTVRTKQVRVGKALMEPCF